MRTSFLKHSFLTFDYIKTDYKRKYTLLQHIKELHELELHFYFLKVQIAFSLHVAI